MKNLTAIQDIYANALRESLSFVLPDLSDERREGLVSESVAMLDWEEPDSEFNTIWQAELDAKEILRELSAMKTHARIATTTTPVQPTQLATAVEVTPRSYRDALSDEEIRAELRRRGVLKD